MPASATEACYTIGDYVAVVKDYFPPFVRNAIGCVLAVSRLDGAIIYSQAIYDRTLWIPESGLGPRQLMLPLEWEKPESPLLRERQEELDA